MEPLSQIPVDPNSAAARCRYARELAGRTRGEIGRTAGLTRGHYNRIENGVKKPTARVCAMISAALEFYGVCAAPMWLIFGTGKRPNKIRKSKVPKEPEAISDAPEA